MFKRLISKVHEVAAGSLQESLVAPRLAVHLGVPDKASVLAYDEVQRVLAIGTRDGRIKIFGGDGVEGLLLSPAKAPCKYLLFFPNKGFLVHVTTHDHIEVWDLDKRVLSASCKWDCVVTAISIAPGTSFMYIGDETGVCRVLQHDSNTGFLRPMSYCIPPHIPLGGLVKPGSSSAPSLVGILPQPTAVHSRLLLGYDNGIMVLWGLHDQKGLVIRGGTQFKLAKLAEHAQRVAELDGSGFKRGPEMKAAENLGSDDDEDDMELCSLCWVCSSGSMAAAGYTSGDVWLWSFPSPAKGVSSASAEKGGGGKEREREAALWAPSGVPLQRIQLSQRPMRMPITALRWCASPGIARGGGRLYALGGGAFETPEMVSVLAVHGDPGPIARRELPWFGPVADVALAPVAGGSVSGPACAALVLTSPGQVHVFDEVEVAAMFQEGGEGSARGPPAPAPKPVHVQSPLMDSMITASAMWCFSADATAIDLLTSLPRSSSSYYPSTLAGGSKWPITGGVANSPAHDSSIGANAKSSVLFTGHRNGIVGVWDASSPMLPRICKVPSEFNKETGEFDGTALHEVTCLDFCSVSGLLCVAQEHGAVRLYALSKERRLVMRHTIDDSCNVKREKKSVVPGFQCVAVLKMHKATVRTVAIASGVSRLALGGDDGVVSVVDLASFSLLYHDKPLPNSPVPITSLCFVPVAPSSDPSTSASTRSPTSPTTPTKGGTPPRASVFGGAVGSVLFVAAKNSTMVIFDGAKGQPSGTPVQPKNPSPCVAIFPLDALGALVRGPVGAESLPWLVGDTDGRTSAPGSPRSPTATTSGLSTSQSFSGTSSRPTSPDHKAKSVSNLSRENSVRSVRSGSGSESESSTAPSASTFSEAAYLLLCSYDCLRLYPIPSLLQGERATARKVKLASGFVPCWASMFGIRGIFPQGLALLSPSGDLDVRSLPDLAEVKTATLSDSLGWQYEPSNSNLQLSSSTPDGRLFVIEGQSELMCMSLIATENALGLPKSLPSLHDEVLAAAADAAEVANTTASDPGVPPSVAAALAATSLDHKDSKKKSFFGAISRDIGSAIKTVAHAGPHAGGRPAGSGGSAGEQASTDHTASDLSVLFLTRPFTAISQASVSSAARGAISREVSGLDSISSLNFDDDIDLQDDASSSSASSKPKLSYTRSESHGKEKEVVESEADTRAQLFGGPAKTAVPHQRTAAEIRAAYGHGRKPADAAGAAGAASMARDKLMERQEKLENISRRTAEMQANAESFASMAEELTKKMEKKSGWW